MGGVKAKEYKWIEGRNGGETEAHSKWREGVAW